MKIYHAPNTRSVRIVWLFEELGLDYELEAFSLGDPKMRDPDYLKVHPMGRVPALKDGDQTLFESGAIVQYVLAKYGDGRLLPDQDSPEFATYLQWFHYAEGMLMPPVNTIVVETILLPEDRRNQVNLDRALKLLTRMLGAVEDGLAGRDYLAGEFSGADIMTGHACVVSARLGADISDKPNVTAYVERLKARPALQKAFAT
ncbi:MAG: glutathione S-transferase family protein [Alphaproteobacteria bacterium]|jgi:glutathione S-transferase|nr:glutathione S-transferase family protein [Alphaproteobacteria bacterium]MDP6565801.1 glutathione S-transferase family protein [Alphaproteobacteria bacterium]MDP6814518.1 glutathione S-transferase family protein [Alphaproteobacteria bacterium]